MYVIERETAHLAMGEASKCLMDPHYSVQEGGGNGRSFRQPVCVRISDATACLTFSVPEFDPFALAREGLWMIDRATHASKRPSAEPVKVEDVVSPAPVWWSQGDEHRAMFTFPEAGLTTLLGSYSVGASLFLQAMQAVHGDAFPGRPGQARSLYLCAARCEATNKGSEGATVRSFAEEWERATDVLQTCPYSTKAVHSIPLVKRPGSFLDEFKLLFRGEGPPMGAKEVFLWEVLHPLLEARQYLRGSLPDYGAAWQCVEQIPDGTDWRLLAGSWLRQAED